MDLKKVALESFWIQTKKSRKPIEYSWQKIGKTSFVEQEFFVHVFQRVERVHMALNVLTLDVSLQLI